MAGDLIDTIRAEYGTFSKGQKRIADYLLIHSDRAAKMTAAKLSKETNVSESTVVRFATQLGFDGYPHMQRSLQETLHSRLTAVERLEFQGDVETDTILETVLRSDINNIKRTLNGIEQDAFVSAVNGMLNAKRIYIMGLRSSAPLALFFAHYLSYILDDVRVVEGEVGHVTEELLRICNEDFLFAISFPRYSKRTVEGVRFAKQKGAMVASLTDSTSSPLATDSDIALIANSSMVSFADSLVAPLSVINALIVALSHAKKEDVSRYLSTLESVWGENETYIGPDEDEYEK